MGNLVLIHTVSPLVELFGRLCQQALPRANVLHVLDEPLLKMIREGAGSTREHEERLRQHVLVAGRVDARIVLVTCSTLSLLVDAVRADAAIPVVTIDEAMLTRAVELGTRIGVVATNRTTLEPTQRGLECRAVAAGKEVEMRMLLVENALQLLMHNECEAHDALVQEAVQSLSGEVDVIVLAQASMARVLDVIPEAERQVPILSSPQLALESIKEFF